VVAGNYTLLTIRARSRRAGYKSGHCVGFLERRRQCAGLKNAKNAEIRSARTEGWGVISPRFKSGSLLVVLEFALPVVPGAEPSFSEACSPLVSYSYVNLVGLIVVVMVILSFFGLR
jgi:hypothetical protein